MDMKTLNVYLDLGTNTGVTLVARPSLNEDDDNIPKRAIAHYLWELKGGGLHPFISLYEHLTALVLTPALLAGYTDVSIFYEGAAGQQGHAAISYAELHAALQLACHHHEGKFPFFTQGSVHQSKLRAKLDIKGKLSDSERKNLRAEKILPLFNIWKSHRNITELELKHRFRLDKAPEPLAELSPKGKGHNVIDSLAVLLYFEGVL